MHIITAIIPVYGEDGDGTTILYDRTPMRRLPTKATTVMTHVAAKRGAHLPTIRQAMSSHKTTTLPLPIDEDHLFIPLKMRRQVIGRDNAYGYINLIPILQENAPMRRRFATVESFHAYVVNTIVLGETYIRTKHGSIRVYCSSTRTKETILRGLRLLLPLQNRDWSS